MAVTTLTGTTWYFKSAPDLSTDGIAIISFSSHINGTAYQFAYLIKGEPYSSDTAPYIWYMDSNSSTSEVYYSNSWAVESARTITFLSEVTEDSGFMTQSGFISWLEANATQVIPEPEYIDKVVLPSEEEYNIKDTISGYLTSSDLVAGTNISIEETSEGQLEISSLGSSTAARITRISVVERKYWVIENPTFTSEMNKTWDVTIRPGWFVDSSAVFNSIKFDSSTGNISLEDGSYHTQYGDYDNVRYDLYANSAWNDMMEAEVSGETQQFGASSPEYIYILGGSDAGDPDFVNWLLTHAVPVAPLFNGASSVTIPAGTHLKLLGFNTITYQEDKTLPFNFTSNNASFTGMKYAYASGQSEYYYTGSSGNTYITNYYTINMAGACPEYGFPSSAYRDIVITDQFTADTTTYYLLANAVVVDTNWAPPAIVDVSSTTATQADFYNSSGQRVQGTLQVNTVYVGSSTPSSGTGENGDIYIVE